jgi:hypothetical protein
VTGEASGRSMESMPLGPPGRRGSRLTPFSRTEVAVCETVAPPGAWLRNENGHIVEFSFNRHRSATDHVAYRNMGCRDAELTFGH